MEGSEDWGQRRPISLQRTERSRMLNQHRNAEQTTDAFSTLPVMEHANVAKGPGNRGRPSGSGQASKAPVRFNLTLANSTRPNVSGKLDVSGVKTATRPHLKVARGKAPSTDKNWRYDSRRAWIERTHKATQEDNAKEEGEDTLTGGREYRDSPNSSGEIYQRSPVPRLSVRRQLGRSRRKKTRDIPDQQTRHSSSDSNRSGDSIVRRSYFRPNHYNEKLGSETLSEDEDGNDGDELRGNIMTARRESVNSTLVSSSTVATPVITQFVRSKSKQESSGALTEATSDKTAKAINQTELEQRMKALRASISDLNRSTQQTISSEMSSTTIKSSETEKLLKQTRTYPSIEDNMLEDRKSSIVDYGILSKGNQKNYRTSSPALGEGVGSLGFQADQHRYTERERNHSNSKTFNEVLNKENTLSDYSRSLTDNTTEESMLLYGLHDIQQEFQLMRKELEQSKFESRQLQQWIVERSHLAQKPWNTKSPSSRASIEKPMRQTELIHGLESNPYPQSFPWSSLDKQSHRDGRSQPRERIQRSGIERRESLESGEPYRDETLHCRYLQKAGSPRKRYESHSTADLSSNAESEYRDPTKRVHMDFSTGDNCSDTLVDVSSGRKEGDKNRTNYICTRIVMRSFWFLFWVLVFAATQLVVMGILFRPQTALNNSLIPDHKNVPKTVNHKARDYVANQIGFYTFLDDGFGMDTLAYCHDLWEFPSDPRSVQRDIPSSFIRAQRMLTKAVSSISDTMNGLYYRLSRPLQTCWNLTQDTWQRVWHQGKEGSDPMDWLYH
ncbi:hypothetical protein BGX27_009726 [Mortierella sp. AM989]|nr:hypothetical protein BGX27_009726 [Mortierella sp. AM989]